MTGPRWAGLGLRVVDLSMTLGPDTVIWPGEVALRAQEEASVAADGFHTRLLTHSEHAGTHLDAPDHFVAGGATVAEIPADRLVVPSRVLDITAAAGRDAGATLQVADVTAHETAHGTIPAGCAVLLRTGWSTRHRDQAGYAGSDDAGGLAFPGYGVEAARLLVQRGVVGLGVDTLGIDPGHATDFPVHRQVSLPSGLWHLENLVALEELPPVGALLCVGVPKVAGASGFPARVLALVPA